MAQFQMRPVVVEATRWFKNGDHPLDNVWRAFEDTGAPPTEPREGNVVRYFRHPQVDGHTLCHVCQQPMNDHGWIDTSPDGYKVCVGDWVVTTALGEHYARHPVVFESTYEPVVAG